MEESAPLRDEEGDEEVHPNGDLPEGLHDAGEQMDERSEEEIPPGTSPPQVPPKLLPQLSSGDGECSGISRLITASTPLTLHSVIS